MKFSIGIDDLLPALQSVIGVVEKRQTLPVLSNILVNIDMEIDEPSGHLRTLSLFLLSLWVH